MFQHLGDAKHFQADGTFRTPPALLDQDKKRTFTQLFTIHISRFGQVFLFKFSKLIFSKGTFYFKLGVSCCLCSDGKKNQIFV